MSPHHALMIVDVQKAFEPPAAFVKKLEQYSRRFSRRVYTRFINPKDSLFRTVLKQRSCLPGSEDTELIIPPQRGDIVIDKTGYGLTAAHIRRLKQKRITRVTVCGLDTDACVLGVMFSLFDAGIRCYLKEAHCWSSSGLHKPALAIIREQFPEIR
jgi:nicotinamidase-related amidase